MKKSRRHEIVELINREGVVSFQRLKSQFPFVSEMTLRTDLKDLDLEGKIIRIYGGAKSCDLLVRSNDVFYKKATRNVAQKKHIAQKALSILKPNMTLFLDCGSTVRELARVMPDERFTIITNSVSSIIELANLNKPNIFMLAGKLNRINLSANNPNNYKAISKINFDISFIATTGYKDGIGFTCTHETDDELRNAAIKQANKVVVLMDSSKVGKVFPVTYASLKDVDMVISDKNLEATTKETFAQNGISLLY